MQYADEFRNAMQDVAAAIDETMSERLLIIPSSQRPNFPSVQHHERAFEVIGVFAWISKLVFDNSKHSRTAGSGGYDISLPIQSRDPKFSFTANAMTESIQRTNWIQRCVNGDIFEVTNLKPDGVSRILADVVQIGRPE